MALYVLLMTVQVFVSQHKILTEIISQKSKFISQYVLFLLQKHIYFTENILNNPYLWQCMTSNANRHSVLKTHTNNIYHSVTNAAAPSIAVTREAIDVRPPGLPPCQCIHERERKTEPVVSGRTDWNRGKNSRRA